MSNDICNRTACDEPAHPECVHRDLHETYCVGCAKWINSANGVELVSLPDDAPRHRNAGLHFARSADGARAALISIAERGCEGDFERFCEESGAPGNEWCDPCRAQFALDHMQKADALQEELDDARGLVNQLIQNPTDLRLETLSDAISHMMRERQGERNHDAEEAHEKARHEEARANAAEADRKRLKRKLQEQAGELETVRGILDSTEEELQEIKEERDAYKGDANVLLGPIRMIVGSAGDDLTKEEIISELRFAQQNLEMYESREELDARTTGKKESSTDDA